MIRHFTITPREHSFIVRYFYEFCADARIPSNGRSFNEILFTSKYHQVTDYLTEFAYYNERLKSLHVDQPDRNRIHLINMECPIMTKNGKTVRYSYRLNDKVFNWLYEELDYWSDHSRNVDDRWVTAAGRRIRARMKEILTLQDMRNFTLEKLLREI